jgi:hypothetical protein
MAKPKIVEEVVSVEQTIREKIVEALAASGLNVQLKHAENIAHRIETLVEVEVENALRLAGIERPTTDVSDEAE